MQNDAKDQKSKKTKRPKFPITKRPKVQKTKSSIKPKCQKTQKTRAQKTTQKPINNEPANESTRYKQKIVSCEPTKNTPLSPHKQMRKNVYFFGCK